MDGDSGLSTWEQFQEQLTNELEASREALREINLMLDQSQAELNKLASRNTNITLNLQQVQQAMDSLPRGDIRMAYDAAMDAQHRMFVMRGQLEKLENDRASLEKYIRQLESTQAFLHTAQVPSSTGEKKRANGSWETVEMLINAQEAERQRLSRQMHDGPAQALSNFILQTEIALRLFDVDQSRARDELGNLKQSAMNTFQKVRTFIFELRPMMLDDLGLIPTVRRYADTFKEQTGVEISVTVTGMERRLEPYLEAMVFHAVRELMGSAARQNQATQVKVTLHMDENQVRVSVEDNGQSGGSESAAAREEGSLARQLIRERVDMLNGSMDTDVTPAGTRVFFQVPTVQHAVR